MIKKDKELLTLARKTLLRTWDILTQDGCKKSERVKMADEVVDTYEAIDSHFNKKK